MTAVAKQSQLFGDPGSGALLSECGRYRYLLTRSWAPGRTALFIMLNPSTADASVDDPTIRKCRGFAERWGCGSLEVVNLFGLRATNPKELRTVADPQGPENAQSIGAALARASENHRGPTVCAWGGFKHPLMNTLEMAVCAMAREHVVMLHCLRGTKSGAPWHPLYVPYDAELRLWP